jgi:hypothetical protein
LRVCSASMAELVFCTLIDMAFSPRPRIRAASLTREGG